MIIRAPQYIYVFKDEVIRPSAKLPRTLCYNWWYTPAVRFNWGGILQLYKEKKEIDQ